MVIDEGDSAGRSSDVAVLPSLTVFRCVNRSGPALDAFATKRQRPVPPPVQSPVVVNDIAVPCVGKLQPEHLLKAFENGVDAVCVIACESDHCRYLEGSQRLDRRAEYVRGLLEEVGLGGERLMVLHLGGSAREDVQVLLGRPWPNGQQTDGADAEAELAALHEQMTVRLRALKTSPLRKCGE